METVGIGKRVRIYIAAQDKAPGSHEPLWQDLLNLLHTEGAAGATLWRGLAGFGARSRVHVAHLADIAPDLPMIVEWIDNPERVARVLPRVVGLVATGMVTVEDVEIVKYTHREPRPLPPDTVADVMTRSVVAVHPDTPLGEVVRMLLYRDYRALPVVDADNRLVGMITNSNLIERGGLSARVDLLAALGGHALEAELARSGVRTRTAGDVMSHDTIAVGPDEPLPRAAHIMVERQVKRLPVVDAHGHLLGIISRLDLLRAIGEGYPVPQRQAAELPPKARTIGELVRDEPAVLPVNAPLGEVVDAVSASPLNRAVIVDDARRVVGVISDADILARLDPGARGGLLGALTLRDRAAAPTGLVAGDLVHTRPITVEAATSISDAAVRMAEAGLKVLPVTDAAGALLGVVDRANVVAYLAAR